MGALFGRPAPEPTVADDANRAADWFEGPALDPLHALELSGKGVWRAPQPPGPIPPGIFRSAWQHRPRRQAAARKLSLFRSLRPPHGPCSGLEKAAAGHAGAHAVVVASACCRPLSLTLTHASVTFNKPPFALLFPPGSGQLEWRLRHVAAHCSAWRGALFVRRHLPLQQHHRRAELSSTSRRARGGDDYRMQRPRRRAPPQSPPQTEPRRRAPPQSPAADGGGLHGRRTIVMVLGGGVATPSFIVSRTRISYVGTL